MSTSESTADVGDRHRRQTALALVLIGISFGASAGEPFVGAAATDALEYVQIACALGMFAIFVPIVLWKFRHAHGSDWHLYRGADGFVAESIARAQIASWSVAFLLVCALSTLDRTLQGVAPETPLKFVASVMAITFGGVFLYLTRAVPDEEDDGFRQASDA